MRFEVYFISFTLIHYRKDRYFLQNNKILTIFSSTKKTHTSNISNPTTLRAPPQRESEAKRW